MAKYLAMRIKAGKLDKDEVYARYPKYKDAIEAILAEE